MRECILRDAFICDYVRTPIGRYAGALAGVRTDDLAAHPIRVLTERNGGVDWEALDECVLGCANQAGEDNRNVARMALLLAGLPETIPAHTINRLCSSGLDAVGAAARAIRSEEAELVLAGGVESMSRAPLVMAKATEAFSRRAEIEDTTIGWRFVNPKMKAEYGIDSMPETAENVAEAHTVSRADQDAFALRSQQRAAVAIERGFFAAEIAPIEAPGRAGATRVDRDEHPRPNTTLADLARLKTPFRQPGTVTAGNSSGVNDGAAALLIASEAGAKMNGLTPRARIVGMAAAGVAPKVMGIGPVPAVQKLLARLDRKLSDRRSDRAERGLREPIPRGPAKAWASRRCRTCEPEWWRDRPRPSARHVGRAAGRNGDARARGSRRPDGHSDAVRRCRSGRRHVP